MQKVTVYNIKGEKVGDQELNPSIFEVEMSEGVMHRAIEAHLANTRKVIASTKTRSEVRGGGRKPWKQKGTGRARAGSSRSPIWVGGGITFGPSNERNFKKKINKKERRKALFMALSEKVLDKKLILLDELRMENIKTKQAAEILSKLPIEGKKALVALPDKDLKVQKSFRNLKKAVLVKADSLNAYTVAKNEFLVMPKEALGVIEKTYLK